MRPFTSLSIHRFHRSALLVALLITLIATPRVVAAGEKLVDDELGFSLVVPEGFIAEPGALEMQPGLAHAFRSGNPKDGYFMLFIEKLAGTIARRSLTSEDLPDDFDGRLSTTRWQGYPVNVVYVTETAEGVSFVTVNAQIPLRPRAVQLKLFGPAEREAELTSLLDEILGNLEGETNWSDPESSERPDQGPRWRVVPLESVTGLGTAPLMGIAAAMGIAGLVGYWLISRNGPKWAVLLTAVVVWAVGISLSGSSIREVTLLSGVCALLGLAGVILGLCDLVFGRKKRRRQPVGNASMAAAPHGALDAEVIDDES